MKGKYFIFASIVCIIIASIVGREDESKAIGFMMLSVVLALTGIAVGVINKIFNAGEKVITYVQSDKFKEAVQKAKLESDKFNKEHRDPENLRDDL